MLILLRSLLHQKMKMVMKEDKMQKEEIILRKEKKWT